MAIFANDLIGSAINAYGTFEKDQLEVLFEFLAPLSGIFSSGTALDIGANIGNHAIYFSKRFAKVHAFEPDPAIYYLLKFNTSGLRNVIAHDFGLGDRDGCFPLLEDPINMGRSRIVTADETGGLVDVRLARIDTSCVRDEELCFLKIDVEGYEAKVLTGGLAMIAKHQPLIVLEQLEVEFKGGTTESLSLLRGLGYKFCWHESGSSSKRPIVRRLINVLELFRGRDETIITGEHVPKGTHWMLVAVPPRFQPLLGV